MEEIDWKKKANLLMYTASIPLSGNAHQAKLRDIMIEFAKLACEEQKKICAIVAENNTYERNCNVTEEVRNSPTVKFD